MGFALPLALPPHRLGGYMVGALFPATLYCVHSQPFLIPRPHLGGALSVQRPYLVPGKDQDILENKSEF